MISPADPSGAPRPALVMVHGFALDARMWRPQLAALAADYRILTVDLPGFGVQSRDVGEVEPAAELARALDACGLAHPHIVASCFGAAVAIDLALRHPDRIASLTLVGPLLLGRRTGIEAWGRCVALASEGDRVTAAEVWFDAPLFEGVRRDEELFDEVRQIVLDYRGAHWTGDVSSKWLEPDPLPRLRTLEIPTLIVSGERDASTFLQMADAYARALPRACRAIVRSAGHLPNLEQPSEFNALLANFLGTIKRSEAPAGAGSEFSG
jgi:pimeloyl-ACP methyl ester carboxylesterase